MLKSFVAFASAAAFFAAATVFAKETQQAEAPDPRIGDAVNSICFARTINGWKALKGVDNVVLLEKGVNDWYYVEVQGYCPSRVFRSAESIGIESRPSGGCVTRGDVIIVRDFGRFTNRCYINNISKWDEKAHLKQSDEDPPADSETEGE